MKRIVSPAALALLLTICAPSMAQQQNSAEDLLRWFPQGQYQNISHRDNVLLRAGSAYALYVKYFEPELGQTEEDKKEPTEKLAAFVAPGSGQLIVGRMLLNKDLKLPPSLCEEIASFTLASATALADEPEEKNRALKELQPHLRQRERAGGPPVRYALVALPPNMAVYRFDDLPAALAAALERNEIADTGRMLGGRPVYSFSLEERAGGKGRYAWGNELGELLVADDPITLRKMFLAGGGEMAGMIDDPEYVDLVTLIPELGAKWKANMPKSLLVLVGNSSEHGDADDADERSRRLREMNGGQPVQTLVVDSMTVADDLISRSYAYYEEREAAEDAYDDGKDWSMGRILVGGKPVTEMDGFQRMFSEHRETERRGDMVMITVIYDEKLLFAEQKMQEAMTQARHGGKEALSFAGPDGREAKPKTIGTPPDPAQGKQKKKDDRNNME